MRLDHLLSKEHSPEHVPAHRCLDDGLAEPVSFPHVERRELTGGTLTTNLFIVWPAFVLVTESVISMHCWVLREHVKCFFLGKTYTCGSSYPYRGVVATLFRSDGCRMFFCLCVV